MAHFLALDQSTSASCGWGDSAEDCGRERRGFRLEAAGKTCSASASPLVGLSKR